MAIEDIRKLRARFARLIDTKDWQGFKELWTDDATMDASVAGGDTDLYVGPDAILNFVSGVLDEAVTVHRPLAAEIEISDPDKAAAIWSMEDLLIWPEGGPMRSLHGYGHYHETYRRIDGEWRVHSFRLTRLHVDLQEWA